MGNKQKVPKPKANRSRTGCERCKARKLKCGEEKPGCRRCIVGNWPCEYIAPKVWLFEPSVKPTHEQDTGLVTSEEICKIPHEHTEPVVCQNRVCQGRSKGKKSTEQGSSRGPLCYGRFLGPVQVDKAGQTALSYWCSMFAPSYALIATIKDGSNGLLTRVLPWALQDDMILDTIMATSLAYAAQGELDTENGGGALRFRQSVVRKVMQRLPYGCDHTTIQAVICLFFTDMRLGLLDHCRAHLQGLRAMVLSCGGLKSLGCDGMQRDIILLLDEVFHIFQDGDDAEICGPRPRPPLLTRLSTFAPEIAAQKLGMVSVDPVFEHLQQQTLFSWLQDPIVLWEEPATPTVQFVEETDCWSAACGSEYQQEPLNIVQTVESVEPAFFDEAFDETSRCRYLASIQSDAKDLEMTDEFQSLAEPLREPLESMCIAPEI